MILIFGCQVDPHVESVASKLTAIGQDYRILDIFDPMSDGVVEAITPRLELALASAKGGCRPNVVWWRIKPAFHIATDTIADYYDQQFAFREWLATLDYMATLYKECAWVNSRAANAASSNKLHQLKVANSLGLRVPQTIFTNNVVRLRSFMLSLEKKRCINKTITPYIRPDLKQKFSTLIDIATVNESVDEIGCCPSIYQEHIVSKYELRITAVGTQFFAAKITKKNPAEPDWRTEIMQDIYEPFAISDPLREYLIRLQDAFDLTFAAYDFIVDESGDIIFLEVNPAGQWLWVEKKLDLPISKALAHFLANLGN